MITQDLNSGDSLHEYRIKKRFTEGNLGTTYLAYDNYLQREVVLKGIPADRVDDFSSALQEVRLLSKINHPNIVKAHRFFIEGDVGYIVMEYVEGQTLKDLLVKGAIGEERARKLVESLSDALEQFHDLGYIHGDIKPANIIIKPDGTPVLIDFGAVQRIKTEQESGNIIFTPSYAPLEQSEGKRLGRFSDVYALAAVAHQCIVGRKPQPSKERNRNDYMLVFKNLSVASPFLIAIDEGLRLAWKQRPRSMSQWRGLWVESNAKIEEKQEVEDVSQQSDAKRLAIIGILLTILFGLASFFEITFDNVVTIWNDEIEQHTQPELRSEVEFIEPVYEPRSVHDRLEDKLLGYDKEDKK